MSRRFMLGDLLFYPKTAHLFGVDRWALVIEEGTDDQCCEDFPRMVTTFILGDCKLNSWSYRDLDLIAAGVTIEIYRDGVRLGPSK